MVGNTGFFLETMGAWNSSWRAGGDFITEHIQDRFPKFNRMIQQSNRVFGTYVQGELPLRSRDRLMAGLRMDAHSALDKPVLNPRVNYLLAFSEALQLRAGVSKGFRAPVLFDEDLHIESVGGLQKRIQNNPGLAPERSTSWQLALEKEQANALSARFVRLGAFLTRLERNFQLEPIFSDDNVFIFERRNGQGASVSGITLEAGFRLAGSWEMQAAWTVQRGRLRDGLAWSETAPPQTAMLRMPAQYGYALISRAAGKNLTLSGDVNITGPMHVPHYAGFIEEDRLVTSPWFFDAGLKAAWKPFTNLRSLTVEFSVRNLFNHFQRDQDAGINRDPGYIYGPLLPRTLYSTIRWTNF
jgi:outer membrane receptor for ferrienterochelin and colicins